MIMFKEFFQVAINICYMRICMYTYMYCLHLHDKTNNGSVYNPRISGFFGRFHCPVF
jgi:hypothetical protein